MIFLGISLISLLLFIVTAGVAFIQPQDSGDDIIFWTIFSEKEAIINTPYPVKINYIFLYILFGIPLLLALLTCACLIIYRKNIGIINGMFGTFSRFHFIPLLCASSLFIIGEFLSSDKYSNDEIYILSFIFSAIGLCSLIFIYSKTSIPSPTPVRLIIKKGLYPCLIALFIYNICYTFGDYGIKKKKKNLKKFDDWLRGCSIAFSIIIGLINLVISIFFKDSCLVLMNILIYAGLIVYFFNVHKEIRKKMNGEAEGIIEIIMEVLSLCALAFMGYKYKSSMF